MATTSCRAPARQVPRILASRRNDSARHFRTERRVTILRYGGRLRERILEFNLALSRKRNLRRWVESRVSSRRDNSKLYGVREKTITARSELRFLSRSAAEEAEHFCRSVSLSRISRRAAGCDRTFLISSRRLGRMTSLVDAGITSNRCTGIINEARLTTSGARRGGVKTNGSERWRAEFNNGKNLTRIRGGKNCACCRRDVRFAAIKWLPHNRRRSALANCRWAWRARVLTFSTLKEAGEKNIMSADAVLRTNF